VRFRDRLDAGRRLAERLDHLRDERPVVLALPRGGVPVAVEVAAHLDAPMDVLVVRKLGLPRQPELGVGAIGEGGERVFNQDLLHELRLSPDDLAEVAEVEAAEVDRRVARYRGGHPPLDVAGRVVLVVDDGVATGFTARAAVEIVRARGAARVVVAVPVGSRQAMAELADLADEVVCLGTPSPFRAIGLFYDDFRQVSDNEVLAGVRHARSGASSTHGDDAPTLEVALGVDDVALPASITVPADAGGLVVFAHGSGSSRHSPRNRYVADALVGAGYATLRFDLLTATEAHDRANVFDVDRLARRLEAVHAWVLDRPALAGLPIGFLGASTGAAAALVAAADLGPWVGAVVSRGGRPDLARARLAEVSAPTLLLVGSEDEMVLDLNRRAERLLTCPHQLVVVPGASHLFEEPGALDQVVAAAMYWFDQHLRVPIHEQG
jgi:putative phosphoribosyl transferase